MTNHAILARRASLGVLMLLFLGQAVLLFDTSSRAPNSVFLAAWAASMLALTVYARSRARSWWWTLQGLVPMIGAPLGVAGIAAVAWVERKQVSRAVQYIARGMFGVVLPVSGMLAIVIPNVLTYGARSRQAEASTNLSGIYIAEQAFFEKHGRYGNFDEIGFKIYGKNRYTYRLGSGATEAVILRGYGEMTPDNQMVAAGISPDGQGFTATATANLDTDPTLDQWHVNDRKEGLGKPDVNDEDHRSP